MSSRYSKGREKQVIYIITLSLLLFILLFLSICVGRYSIPITDVFRIFIGKEALDPMAKQIIWYLRIPRTILAAFIGSALSISGVIYQSIFNNKLVSPDLLGVSSGASAGACIAILLGLSKISTSISSFVGGTIAVLLTIIIAKILKNKSNSILLLSGIAVSGLMSSLVGLMKYLADNDLKLAEMTYWLLGDISKTNINDVFVMTPVVAVGIIIALLLSWSLNIISLGNKEGIALGVNYKLTTAFLISIATLLTASSVAISGTVGWIGLVVPNMVRLIAGSDNRKIIPISLLVGSCFMVIVDMLARSLAPNEIPLSIVTGLLGTPLFLFAIFKKRKEIQ